jgi:hypothetical protein
MRKKDKMRPILRFAAFVVFVVVFSCASGHARSNRVQVDQNQITVHVDGIALEDILETVANSTGVQFIVDQELAKKRITLEFDRLPLADGIKKILFSVNHAILEDDSGKLWKVFVFGQGTDSLTFGETNEPDESDERPTRRHAAKTASLIEESDATELMDPEALTEEEEFDSADDEEMSEDSVSLTNELSESHTTRSYAASRTQENDTEGPPIGQDQEFEGPPESQGQESTGPPGSDETPSDGPPNMVEVDQGPPMTSESGQTEGPPQE